MSIWAKLIRKFIPLMAITGATGGMTSVVMEFAGSEKGLWELLGISVIYIIAGTAVGFILTEILQRKGTDIVKRNVKGEPLIAKQPAYLMTAGAFIVAFILNMKAGIGFAFASSLFLGFNFLMGISNGIFDYRESVTKNLLYTGIVPIGLVFIYGYYIGRTDTAVAVAWFLGSMYLLCYLLFINRMQLDSIIFFRKSVNIEDSRKIRIFNDIMIFAFYCIYLFMFNFRNLIKVSREAVSNFIAWFFALLEKISDWLIADIPDMEREPIEKIDELIEGERTVTRPWMQTLLKIIMFVLLGAVVIGLLLAIIGFIVKLVKKIRESMRLSYNRKASEKRTSSEEYVEESEIVKDERNNSKLRSRKRKYKYNLRELGKIPLAADKIRYLYGFVLERLYHKHISIEESDTPEQILGRIKGAENGEKLEKMGFAEFTQNYERVRYGKKDVELKENLVKKGESFEKAVSSMSEDKS